MTVQPIPARRNSQRTRAIRLTRTHRAAKLLVPADVSPPEIRHNAEVSPSDGAATRENPILKRGSKKLAATPRILIFDVDGVLVDVRLSFWLSALETVRFLTGKRVTWAELHKWKAMPGNNDDWNMVARWTTALGRPTSYEEARDAFQPFYWGKNGKPGNVAKEKLLVKPEQIARWARRFELNLFTGRTRKEFAYTFDGWKAAKHFRTVITMDDVRRKKPFPDGLLKILGEREPTSALYIGDNVDDALSAQAAEVPFVAIVPRRVQDYRERAATFRELGALALLPRVTALNALLPAK